MHRTYIAVGTVPTYLGTGTLIVIRINFSLHFIFRRFVLVRTSLKMRYVAAALLAALGGNLNRKQLFDETF